MGAENRLQHHLETHTYMNIAPQRRFVDQGEARIEVLARGDGPTVLLIPSLGRGAQDFDDLASRLAAAGFRAITPQPRGWGASRGPMEHITLHDYAKDMAAIINANDGGPAVIGGHAFGNFVARTTAADFPHLVNTVVLIAATHMWPLPDHIRKSIHDSHITAQPERQLRALQHAFFAPGHDASVWLGGWNEAVMHAERVATDTTPKPQWWHAGTAPVLDIIPADDIMTPPHERDRYVKEMGAHRVSTVLIPDAGHALLPEQPEATANALLNYLKARRQDFPAP
jgi:pimeloyl-ACP methyl ester carboxylesterase